MKNQTKLLVVLALITIATLNPGQTYAGEKSPEIFNGENYPIVFVNDGKIIVRKLDLSVGYTIARGDMPSWSPDGKRIAYEKREGTTFKGISIFDLRTTESTTLTESGSNPLWSPSMKYIIYRKNKILHAINMETKEVQVLGNISPLSTPQFLSPNGVIFKGSKSFYTHDLENKKKQEVTIPSINIMTISPDFKKQVNTNLHEIPMGGAIDTRAITGKSLGRTNIILVDMEKGKIKMAYSKEIIAGRSHEKLIGEQKWSFESNKFAFSGFEMKYSSTGPGNVTTKILNNIYIYNLKDERTIKLPYTFKNVLGIDWLPGGKEILVSRLQENGYISKIDRKESWVIISIRFLFPEILKLRDTPERILNYDTIVKWNINTNESKTIHGHSVDVYYETTNQSTNK